MGYHKEYAGVIGEEEYMRPWRVCAIMWGWVKCMGHMICYRSHDRVEDEIDTKDAWITKIYCNKCGKVFYEHT